MAHSISLAEVTANGLADYAASRCAGGTVQIRDGAQPATADTAASGTLLATCTFANPAFSAAVAGVATALPITQDASADASGTAAWFRVLALGGATVMDGSCGVGANFDCNVVSTTVVAGAPFPIASMVITQPLV